jgi:hypothetical protein
MAILESERAGRPGVAATAMEERGFVPARIGLCIENQPRKLF